MMFISNPEKIQSESYICGRIIAEYLMDKHQIPLLARIGQEYIFAKTKDLEFALSNLPWYIKLLFR